MEDLYWDKDMAEELKIKERAEFLSRALEKMLAEYHKKFWDRPRSPSMHRMNVAKIWKPKEIIGKPMDPLEREVHRSCSAEREMEEVRNGVLIDFHEAIDVRRIAEAHNKAVSSECLEELLDNYRRIHKR